MSLPHKDAVRRVDELGYRLRQAADLIQTDQVFAWTIALVVVMAGLEMGVLRPLEKHLFTWKKAAENP
jgi:NitT/TauT family transport system permease protein